MAGGALRVRVNVDIDFVPAGTGGAALSPGDQANDPGFGQSGGPGTIGIAETLRLFASEPVPGTAGAYTVANINTAMTNIANDIAGATGTPRVTAAILALINGWGTGSP